MKLGVLTVLYQNLPLEAALDKIKRLGVEAVELGTGNFPGNAHCNPDELLADDRKVAALQKAVADRGLVISALSCHGNPLHPNRVIAAAHHEVWRKTALLAEKLGVECVNAFAGCPGDSDTARAPNWVTCAWPPEFLETLTWQWEQKVIPYWRDEAAFARAHGVKIAFEMHPGFVVYNPETALKLRDAVGPEIGVNFDPSHLFWQGIDAVEAIKTLGRAGAIFHVHAKDTNVDARNVQVNGVLDTKPYGQVLDRSWTFRTCGYGHGHDTWKAIVSALRTVGYDWVLSIEHEDALASVDEGLGRAVRFLQECILGESPAPMWWA